MVTAVLKMQEWKNAELEISARNSGKVRGKKIREWKYRHSAAGMDILEQQRNERQVIYVETSGNTAITIVT